jgi:flagellar biogenesis protein FliO
MIDIENGINDWRRVRKCSLVSSSRRVRLLKVGAAVVVVATKQREIQVIREAIYSGGTPSEPIEKTPITP